MTHGKRTVSVGMASALLILIALGAPPAVAGDGERIALTSVYLAQPLGSAHRVEIVGVLGGKARVTLDVNTCTVNPFGDPEICTEIAALPVEVAMKQAKLADPSRQGRRLFLLAGDLGPKGWRWFLVAPRDPNGVYRLIVDRGQGRLRVLTLERLPTPKREGPAPRPPVKGKPTLGEAIYTAERIGDQIRITAKGDHPSLGYLIMFGQSRRGDEPLEIRFRAVAPKVPSAQVITPFEVHTTIEAAGDVTHVTVHDAKGEHRIPVVDRRPK